MLVKNKTVIELTLQDAEKIIYEHFKEKYGDGEYSIKFTVGVYFDKHEFDGIKVVITK